MESQDIFVEIFSSLRYLTIREHNTVKGGVRYNHRATGHGHRTDNYCYAASLMSQKQCERDHGAWSARAVLHAQAGPRPDPERPHTSLDSSPTCVRISRAARQTLWPKTPQGPWFARSPPRAQISRSAARWSLCAPPSTPAPLSRLAPWARRRRCG